jgi:hypothetical protein
MICRLPLNRLRLAAFRQSTEVRDRRLLADYRLRQALVVSYWNGGSRAPSQLPVIEAMSLSNFKKAERVTGG